MHYIDKLLWGLSCQWVGFYYDNIGDSFDMELESMKLLYEVFKKGIQLPILVVLHIFSMPLPLVRITIFLNPCLEANKEASLMAVTMAIVISPVLRLWHPTNRTCPNLFFPMKAVSCQFLCFAPTPAVRMRICQSSGSWVLFLGLLGLTDVGVLVCWGISVYLFIKDWTVSNTSVGFGCLPSKMTWFLWNQRHQVVVMTMDNV